MKFSCLINNIRVYLKLICILAEHTECHFARHKRNKNIQRIKSKHISE